MKSNGFTLIELVVTIAIIAVLSAIILFSVTQYVSTGKDSNISGNLAVLIPAGEVWYNGNSNSYENFCDPAQNSVFKNVISQMPDNLSATCYSSSFGPTANPKGVCCNVDTQYHDAWAACAQEFTKPSMAYCVDSRGLKEEMCSSFCNHTITQCPDVTQCSS